MRLFERNLKKIIKEIEKYGSVRNVEVENSSLVILSPSLPSDPKPSKISEVDLNKANKFKISFILGDEKDEIK